MATPPSVVLSAHIMALGVVRSLGHRGVRSVVVRYSPRTDIAHRSRYVSRSVRVRHPDEAEESLLHALRRLGPGLEGSPLVPASDETLTFATRHRNELSRWYRVLAPSADIVERIIRKEHTYALAEELGIAAPRTRLLARETDLDAVPHELGFPCLVKPSQSHRYFERFGRKMTRVTTFEELRAAYAEAAAAGLDVLAQELIPGDDTHGVNYNSYRVAGHEPVEFTARKVRLTPRNFGPPSVVVSARVEEVLAPARRLLDAFGFEGYSCVEFKRDARDGGYRLMEVNGRFNLSSLLAERCGINFAWLAYRHAVHGDVPVASEYREGVYWIDGTKDVVYGVPELLRRPGDVARFAAPYRREAVFAVFDPHDLRPFAQRYGLLAGAALGSIRARMGG
jgi:predicted ATP-grasp superfamily ATP-dependent carboligase